MVTEMEVVNCVCVAPTLFHGRVGGLGFPKPQVKSLFCGVCHPGPKNTPLVKMMVRMNQWKSRVQKVKCKPPTLLQGFIKVFISYK